ncbi:GNAT family N-acetyltransferase [Rhodoplanes sp. TEM]|uniref:GNAT family N-acetyltransferase n=1 Tax=Rhodoplanes tepidamans TaxID=200616 RepID=A0ABT5J3L0_RHOTP|nr:MULTISPECIES: GNAT family N-acetyltransferase [Rhodoplanes]MDC7784245.1 GNAT family N-acetyltransferase [Rhodoplanes tepidamans]MDC7983637.1 GNAT family N-acetyltransferase [Rhodoplanes sp. TEM]MDQ0353645.1 GNAT superfamily N-acetyltransferase [Rhodoplanes tepidamans]
MREVPQRLAVGEARWPQDRALVERLFRDYVAWAGGGLGDEDVDREVARLPGRYAPPHGCVLIAHAGPDPVGVAAYRRRRGGVCELKRMFVRPAFRGLRIAEALLAGLIETAAGAGYRSMVLELGGDMAVARELYDKAGFAADRRRAPARPGLVVLRRDLKPARTRVDAGAG